MKNMVLLKLWVNLYEDIEERIIMKTKVYQAVYSDNYGIEKCIFRLEKGNIKMKIRNIDFESSEYDFDFFTSDAERANELFDLNDNELINFVVDIKVPLLIEDQNTVTEENAIIRLERQESFYHNRLMVKKDGITYMAEGLDLSEMLYNMESQLPDGCRILRHSYAMTA